MGNLQCNRGQGQYLQECNNNRIHNNNSNHNSNSNLFNNSKMVLLIGQSAIPVYGSDRLFRIIQVNKLTHHNMDNMDNTVNIINTINTINIISTTNIVNTVSMDISLLKVIKYVYSEMLLFKQCVYGKTTL